MHFLFQMNMVSTHSKVSVLTDNTQPPSTGTDEKNLIIGLDFGASFTKVVIGDGRVRYAVPLGACINDSAFINQRFIVPSLLNISDTGTCCIATDVDSARRSDNLNLPLLGESHTDDDHARVAAYLALVFRATRGWLLDKYQQRYNGIRLNWSVNIGLPSAQIVDSKQCGLFQQLAHTAWVVSVLPGPITLKRVLNYLSADAMTYQLLPEQFRSRIIDKQQIRPVPAHAAQIYGFAHANPTSTGLHMLIDIGTDSLGITTFDIESAGDEGKRICIDHSDIEPLGVEALLERRLKNLGLSASRINPFQDAPSIAAFAEQHDLSEKEVKIADTLYSRDVTRLLNSTLDKARARNSDSGSWETGIPTLCSCGGARLDVCQNISHRFEDNQSPHKIAVIKPQSPEDLIAEALTQEDFDRLAVAYGLSFEACDILGAFGEQRTAQGSDDRSAVA